MAGNPMGLTLWFRLARWCMVATVLRRDGLFIFCDYGIRGGADVAGIGPLVRG